MRKAIALLTILYIGSQAFDSVIRWVLNMAHADAAIYLRDVDLICVIALCLYLIAQDRRDVSRTIMLGVIFAALACVSLGSALGVPQTLFGVKVWLPFIAGVLLVESGAVEQLDRPRLWSAVWLSLCTGILLNYFVVYPWSGLLVDVGDVAISANREWTAGGIRRLSGFSRSSFEGAIFVLLLFTYLLYRWRGFFSCAVLIGVSLLAIALTTTKGAVAALLFCLLLAPFLARVRVSSSLLRLPLLGGVLSVAAAGLVVPLLSEQLPFPRLYPGSVSYWLFGSFIERAEMTWPRAFELLASPWQWITGRGLGGIGVSQLRFELNVYSPADNFFVYLFVTAGVTGALLYVFVSLAVLRLDLTLRQHRLALLFVGSCMTYGLTMNVVESAAMVMALGAATSFLAALSPVQRLAADEAAERARLPVRHYS
jgi:hypothetical protein